MSSVAKQGDLIWQGGEGSQASTLEGTCFSPQAAQHQLLRTHQRPVRSVGLDKVPSHCSKSPAQFQACLLGVQTTQTS